MKRFYFTEEQKAFMLANYLVMSQKAIARKFNCDHGCVMRFYMANSLTVPKEIVKKFRAEAMCGKTNFTAEEDAFIRENYLAIPIKALGDQIGRSYTGVMAAIKRMGLVLPPEIIARNRLAGRIKEGNTPKNKGRKQAEWMSTENIEKTAATRFKKGNIPPNTKAADGEIVIRHSHLERGERPYKWIRISLGKWRQLQHVNWEKVNGPIPKGYCLWCLGDTLDCDPGNWELITRKENYIRNSGSVTLNDKYVATKLATQGRKVDHELRDVLLKHTDLLELKRQELLLSRTIKQYEHAGK